MKPGPADLERVLDQHQFPPAARALIEGEIRRLREPPVNVEAVRCERCKADCLDFRQRDGERVCILCVSNEADGVWTRAFQGLLDALDNAITRSVLESTNSRAVPIEAWDALLEARAAIPEQH
jgi:hypothetical protein